MKIAICGDVHWSQYSSIVRKQGKFYSERLEGLIRSLNWFNQLAKNCEVNFYLGDFFDKPELNASEISALNEIEWNDRPKYFLAGNHEMASIDHKYSSAKIFDLLENSKVITSPDIIRVGDLQICLLPYILETDRKPLIDYFNNTFKIDYCKDKFGLRIPRLLLSHNDIAGIQMGKFKSEAGFSINEIEDFADLTINGHLHNGEKISDKIINIGNIFGQNFSEDASKYDHCAFILDTNTLKIEVYENPYSFNFYKFDLTNTTKLPEIKPNAVISIKCKAKNVEKIKSELLTNKNVLESRITIVPDTNISEIKTEEKLTVDHLETFRQYVLDNFENSKELLEELSEVLS